MRKALMIFLPLLICCLFACAQQAEIKPILLPQPRTMGGKPLMDALKERKTARSFSAQTLDHQMIADLLWAAFGINRPEEGRRTAPSASNKQGTDIYICLPEGVYLYDAKQNTLNPVVAGDHRASMGKQSFVGDAPVVLVFIADYNKMNPYSKENKDFYSATDVGYISQNVYLFCASEGLSTVVLGYIDRTNISEVLKLTADQKVMLSQCVGFPGK